MQAHVSVEQWVSMFREIGLDDDKMHEWHRLFEARHPEEHESFLRWLGLPDEKVAQIRKDVR